MRILYIMISHDWLLFRWSWLATQRCFYIFGSRSGYPILKFMTIHSFFLLKEGRREHFRPFSVAKNGNTERAKILQIYLLTPLAIFDDLLKFLRLINSPSSFDPSQRFRLRSLLTKNLFELVLWSEVLAPKSTNSKSLYKRASLKIVGLS